MKMFPYPRTHKMGVAGPGLIVIDAADPAALAFSNLSRKKP